MFIRNQAKIATINDATAFLKCHFNAAAYSDSLYDDFGVPFPQKLRVSATKRKAEFLAGRLLARTALLSLGSTMGNVDIGTHREPIWPSGFWGSISHTDNSAVVLVSAQRHCLIGVDIESVVTDETAKSIAQLVLTPKEQVLLASAPEHYATNLTVVFSAKEALFKALFPTVRCFFGFDAAELTGLPTSHSVTLNLTTDLQGGYARGSEVKLSWRILDGDIMTYTIA